MKGFSSEWLKKHTGKAQPKRKKPPTWYADSTIDVLVGHGLPEPVLEHRFHPVRRWRFDIAWADHMIALEVEGGVWTGGRHTRGSGFMKDMEKYNTAAAMGWIVLRAVPRMLPGPRRGTVDEELLNQLQQLFKIKKAA